MEDVNQASAAAEASLQAGAEVMHTVRGRATWEGSCLKI